MLTNLLKFFKITTLSAVFCRVSASFVDFRCLLGFWTDPTILCWCLLERLRQFAINFTNLSTDFIRKTVKFIVYLLFIYCCFGCVQQNKRIVSFVKNCVFTWQPDVFYCCTCARAIGVVKRKYIAKRQRALRSMTSCTPTKPNSHTQRRPTLYCSL